MKMENILPFDGEAYHFPSFMGKSYFGKLEKGLHWQQGYVTLFGKTYAEPRLTAWYGDVGSVYTYSGRTMKPLAWTDDLLDIRQQLMPFGRFNACLANFYRDGKDAMGFHADNERELGALPVIASLSFGGTRAFVLRHRKSRVTVSVNLNDGDLLLMRGATQDFWVHGLPRRARATSRINLTFRYIYGPAETTD